MRSSRRLWSKDSLSRFHRWMRKTLTNWEESGGTWGAEILWQGFTWIRQHSHIPLTLLHKHEKHAHSQLGTASWSHKSPTLSRKQKKEDLKSIFDRIKAVKKLQMALLPQDIKMWRDNVRKHSPCSSTRTLFLSAFLISPLNPKTSSLPCS